MSLRGWLLSATAAAGIALGVVLVVSTRDDGDARPADELVAGQIYSTDRGDPIDLLYGPTKPGMGCMTFVSAGVFYTGGSNRSCFDLDEVDEGGTYQLVLARRAEDPAVLVGVLPPGAIGATVSGVGRKPARAETRGRWFLVLLEPADPDVLNLETLDVDFEY
jgi:hypothetical protein